MWRGSSSPPSSAWRPSTSCASSRLTSAAVSARRFSSIPKKSWRLWAARRVGRPVKWVSDRSEAFLTDAHGRDHVTHAEMAFDAGGKILGLRVKTIANLGATCDLLVGGADLSCTRRCCRASTLFRRSIAKSTRSIPTRCRSMPIAAPGGRKRRFVVERLMEVGAREIGPGPGGAAAQEFRQDLPAPDAGDHGLRRRRL